MKKFYALMRLSLHILKEEFYSIFRIRRKPRVIQLPVTGRCNSRCLTCNVWKTDKSEQNDIQAEKLRKIFEQPFFSKVTSVGLNGGQITLDNTALDVVDSVLTLPQIKSINLISNGIYTKKLIEYAHAIYEKCHQRGIYVTITLSFDGINEIQKKVRGVSGAWDKAIETLNELKSNQSLYCDRLGVGCTISRHNVAYLPQVDDYFSAMGVSVEYHLAVPNKRIRTFNAADYSVLNDEKSRLLAQEFFYRRMNLPNVDIINVIRYYLQYKYLANKGKGRLALCSFLNQDITIDENLKMYLCATASDEIGDLYIDKVEDIFKSNTFKTAYKNLCSECNSCIHYTYYPTLAGLLDFLAYKLKNKHSFVINKYKFLLKW